MAYLLDRVKESLIKQGISPRTNQSREWIRSKIQNLNPSRQALMSDRTRLQDTSIVGKMYFYYYDAKTKDKLPYFDRFPLVIPIETYNDSFLGLNLHYIHPKQRLILLDKLSTYANNDNYDKTTKLRLSYILLKRAAKIYEMNACIKKYLFSNVRSRFLEISADEWDIAALLPSEDFVGSSISKVYTDSRNKF